MYRKSLMLMVCAIAIIATAACAEADSSISTKLDLAYVTKYVWRGLAVSPDPCIQPSVTIAHSSGLSANVWANGDLTAVNGGEDKLTEIDYTLDYATTLGGRSVNGGLIHYSFPNTSYESTTEAYAAVCLCSTLAPTISANYDFDEAEGCYASLGLGYSCAFPWQKTAGCTLNLAAKVSYATAGYNEFYFGAEKAAFTDMLITASLPMTLAGRVSLTPSVSYSRLLDSELRDSAVDPDNLWFGLTASMAL